MNRQIRKTIAMAFVFSTAVGIAASTSKSDRSVEVDFALTLGEETFDPMIQLAPMPLEWGFTLQTGEDLRLTQFDGPIQESWVQAMRDAGLVPIQYIHPYTYITWATPEARETVKDVPHVRWVGDFVNGFRVLPKWRNLDETPIKARVLVYKGVDLEIAKDELNTVHLMIGSKFSHL